MIPGPFLLILYILYGAFMGMITMYGIARKKTAKELRNRFVKIAETHTLTIADFAGKDVSLERFCDRLFGPEAYYQDNPETRKQKRLNLLVAILLLLSISAAVLTAIYYN